MTYTGYQEDSTMSITESSSENGAYRVIPGGPLEPEMIVAPKGQWHDGAVETFDAGAAYHKCGCGGAGYVALTVGLWAEGKGDDPTRKPSDFVSPLTVCFTNPHDARVAAMALHEAADQMFRAAADLDKRRCMYRATHGREALASSPDREE